MQFTNAIYCVRDFVRRFFFFGDDPKFNTKFVIKDMGPIKL